jgi:hypothetical protein
MAHTRIRNAHGEIALIRSTLTAALLASTALAFVAGAAHAETKTPRAEFAVIPHLVPNIHTGKKGGTLPGTWTYSYTYKSAKYTETWIGANPSSATSETIPIYLIPLKMTFGKTKEDATSIIPSIEASPVFTPTDFKFGGVDLGTTQYEDAFAKANVYSIGGSASGYHVLLGTPTVTKTETLKVPSNQGGVQSEFGVTAILASINWFDPKINALITKLKIPTNSLPIFVTTQTYLLEDANVNDCCIGGYHSVTASGQPYSMFTFIQKSGAFSQDVSALSHELSEWVDDPYTANNSPCGIYEVGDPLERETNYGDYPYVLNGVTYHLQDEALLPYFGGPTGVTLGNMETLQGTKLAVCQNGS